MDRLAAALADHRFEHLFIECLGWDRMQSNAELNLNQAKITLAGVAQKRGFSVFACIVHRTVLSDRETLREIQKLLRKTYYEHILIHCCDSPRKQVWQWATNVSGNRRVQHHEHPFFSDRPPPRLLERLRAMTIPIEMEEETSLIEVLSHVRRALSPKSEFDLFARYPKYAAQSDALAMAVKRGEPNALTKFIELHIPLARNSSKMLTRWLGMDPDDAEQTAMIGLIEAARRFDPERGYQFSTYASYWIRQSCQRFGPAWELPIRLPAHVFWQCYKMAFKQTFLTATYGVQEGRERFAELLENSGISQDLWMSYCAARNLYRYTDIDHAQRWKFVLQDDIPDSLDRACADELISAVYEGMEALNPRQRLILKLRYGFKVNKLAVEDLAQVLGLTTRKARSMQAKAEATLEEMLRQINRSEHKEESKKSSVDDIRRLVRSLPPELKRIMKLRYGFGVREHTLNEVADVLGITRERIRQIQAKAEEKLVQLLHRFGYGDEFSPVPAKTLVENVEMRTE
jgi:RNA polymerase primary sigma factor